MILLLLGTLVVWFLYGLWWAQGYLVLVIAFWVVAWIATDVQKNRPFVRDMNRFKAWPKDDR